MKRIACVFLSLMLAAAGLWSSRLPGGERSARWVRLIVTCAPADRVALETLLAAGAESRDPRERARDDLIRSLARGQAERLGRYVCSYCGFKARTYYWQCPGCSRWDSYAPRRGEGIGE